MVWYLVIKLLSVLDYKLSSSIKILSKGMNFLKVALSCFCIWFSIYTKPLSWTSRSVYCWVSCFLSGSTVNAGLAYHKNLGCVCLNGYPNGIVQFYHPGQDSVKLSVRFNAYVLWNEKKKTKAVVYLVSYRVLNSPPQRE